MNKLVLKIGLPFLGSDSDHRTKSPVLFKCEYCGYTTARKSYLTNHMRKHTGNKFKCEFRSVQLFYIWGFNKDIYLVKFANKL